MSYKFDSDRFNITQDYYYARDFVHEFSEKLHSYSYNNPSYKFDDLYKYLLDYRTIWYAYHEVKSNKGSPGIDGQSFSDINEREFILGILRDLHRRKYRPNFNLVVRVDKGNGKTRILKIPTIRDRTLQKAITFILNKIFEPVFHKCSFAYRPKITQNDAIYSIRDNIKDGRTTVFDADIEKCFDSLNHSLVLDTLYKKITDRDLLRIIYRILETPSFEKGQVQKPYGLSQGGVTSPLLSNLALHHLDDYFHQKQFYEVAGLVRYSDDFVVMADHRWSQKIFDDITNYLQNEMGLRLNQEKTKTLNMRIGTPLNFLGYTIRIERVQPLQMVIQPKHKNIDRIKSSITELLEEANHKKIHSQLASFYSYYSACNKPEIFEDINNHARAGGYNLETIF